jgi:hypothetical protein
VEEIHRPAFSERLRPPVVPFANMYLERRPQKRASQALQGLVEEADWYL